MPVLEVGWVDAAGLRALDALEPDVAAIACFPWLFSRPWRDRPPRGCVNLHPSLLPAYRGPAPLFWQFRAGETRTGVSLHVVDGGADTGSVIAQEAVPFPDGIDTAGAEALTARAGARLCAEWLAGGKTVGPSPPGRAPSAIRRPPPRRASFPSPGPSVAPSTSSAARGRGGRSRSTPGRRGHHPRSGGHDEAASLGARRRLPGKTCSCSLRTGSCSVADRVAPWMHGEVRARDGRRPPRPLRVRSRHQLRRRDQAALRLGGAAGAGSRSGVAPGDLQHPLRPGRGGRAGRHPRGRAASRRGRDRAAGDGRPGGRRHRPRLRLELRLLPGDGAPGGRQDFGNPVLVRGRTCPTGRYSSRTSAAGARCNASRPGPTSRWTASASACTAWISPRTRRCPAGSGSTRCGRFWPTPAILPRPRAGGGGLQRPRRGRLRLRVGGVRRG